MGVWPEEIKIRQGMHEHIVRVLSDSLKPDASHRKKISSFSVQAPETQKTLKKQPFSSVHSEVSSLLLQPIILQNKECLV